MRCAIAYAQRTDFRQNHFFVCVCLLKHLPKLLLISIPFEESTPQQTSKSQCCWPGCSSSATLRQLFMEFCHWLERMGLTTCTRWEAGEKGCEEGLIMYLMERLVRTCMKCAD